MIAAGVSAAFDPYPDLLIRTACHKAAAKVDVMKPVLKSNKLADVCYDIRGPVLQQAKKRSTVFG